MSDDRFETLWSDFLEGDLGEAELAELDALLGSRPELVDRAMDLYEVHRGIGLLHQEKDPGLFARSTLERLRRDREGFVSSLKSRLEGRERPRRIPWAGYGAVAAATLLFSLVLHLLLTAGARQEREVPSPVATLVRMDKARWEPAASRQEGERLSSGPLHLAGGNAVLVFDGGAIVALYGPADFEIESRGSAWLRQGKISVRAELDAAGFIVHTPSGEAVDLGTEFVVAVDLSGAAEIHVQEGEVAWSRTPGGPPTQTLKSGQALRSEGGTPERSIAFVAQSLDDFLRQLSHEVLPTRPTAEEEFRYPPGELALAAATAGSGWSGPWRHRRGIEQTREPDGSAGMRILPESLEGVWFPGTQAGGSLALPPGNNVTIRELTEPIDLDRDAVYYLSFLLRREADAAPGRSDPPHFRLTLRSSRDYWGSSITAGLPISLRPTLQYHGRGSFASPTPVAVGETTLWVLKIVAGRSRPDEVFLKVFRSGEAVPRLEPAPWTVLTGPLAGGGLLDLVVVTGSGPATHAFDRLRIGRTWESVLQKP